MWNMQVAIYSGGLGQQKNGELLESADRSDLKSDAKRRKSSSLLFPTLKAHTAL